MCCISTTYFASLAVLWTLEVVLRFFKKKEKKFNDTFYSFWWIPSFYFSCTDCFHAKVYSEDVLFLQPPAKGAFLRGSGMDQSTGRFTAPVTGIYQFSANVHIGRSQ